LSGAPKATLAKTFLPREGAQEFVNADECAQDLRAGQEGG